jgi:hypothetical protein
MQQRRCVLPTHRGLCKSKKPTLSQAVISRLDGDAVLYAACNAACRLRSRGVGRGTTPTNGCGRHGSRRARERLALPSAGALSRSSAWVLPVNCVTSTRRFRPRKSSGQRCIGGTRPIVGVLLGCVALTASNRAELPTADGAWLEKAVRVAHVGPQLLTCREPPLTCPWRRQPGTPTRHRSGTTSMWRRDWRYAAKASQKNWSIQPTTLPSGGRI